MIVHYLKIAFRNLWKYKFQNTIGIIGVSVGLICFTLICYFPRFIMGMDSHYPNASRMYVLELDKWSVKLKLATNIEQYLISNHPNEVEKQTYILRRTHETESISFSGKKDIPYEFNLTEADTSLLSFFSLTTIAGTKQAIIRTPNSVVLFETFAKNFGDPQSLIGGNIQLKDKLLQVTGILNDLPANSTLGMDTKGFIFNLTDSDLSQSKFSPGTECRAFVLLKKNVNPENFQTQLNQSGNLFRKSGDENSNSIKVSPINVDFNETPKALFLIIYGVAFLILLTTLFNFISFLLTQFYERFREAAIRKVSGSSSIQTFWLFFIEFIIALSIAFFISFLLLDLIKPYLMNIEITTHFSFDYAEIKKQLIEYLVAGLPLSALLCYIPAKIIDRHSIQRILSGVSKSGKKSKVRSVILFIQIIIFLFFISTSLILQMQIKTVYTHIFNSFTEEEKENIISCVSSSNQLKGKKEILLSNIQASPYIEKAIYSYSEVSNYSALLDVSGVLDQKTAPAFMYGVSPQFLDFFRGEMVAGTFFPDTSNPQEAVIDESFAALYPGENSIGKTFTCDYGEFTIIGIMKNIQKTKENNSLAMQKCPHFYSTLDIRNGDFYVIYAQSVPGRLKDAKLHIEKSIREFLPETLELKISTLAEDLKKQQFGPESLLSEFLFILGSVALMICLLSLYSSIALNTDRRRKEIAIRKINGAGIWEIIRLFARTYIRILTGACILVFPVIYYMGNKWLEDYNQRISLNWIFFLSIYLMILTLVIGTIIFRIWKVAQENPAEVIKTE